MENLLLVLDELDDLVAMAGLLWRPIASFLLAVTLFVATGFVFYSMPILAELAALGLVTLGVIDSIRERNQARVAPDQIEEQFEKVAA
jgi:hypothetical protein